MIKKYLAIIALPIRKEAWDLFNAEYLKTSARRKMYKWFNGKTAIPNIAKKVGVSGEAVRILVRDLENNGLIEFVFAENKRFPKRIIDEQ